MPAIAVPYPYIMDGTGKRALKSIPKALRRRDNSGQPGTRAFFAAVQEGLPCDDLSCEK